MAANGNNIRYLFEGATGTSITNSASINAGLKASTVENTGTINGGRYGIYALSNVINSGTVSATAVSDSVYGIYTDGSVDLTKLGTVSSTSTEGTAIGIHFGQGTLTLTNDNVKNITASSEYERYLFEGASGTTINSSATLASGLKAGVVNNSGTISAGRYGIYALQEATNTGTITSSRYGIYSENGGPVTNSNKITVTGSSADTYGIQTSAYVDNQNGQITVTTTSGASYGVHTWEEVDNTGGTITATATASSGSAYGIYSLGTVDLSKLGTITSNATYGKAVGVHFENGSIELSSDNIGNITVSGVTRYLFEGALGTTIRNSATINAGLRAGTVENSGTVKGGTHGIYAQSQITNTGTVTATTSDVAAYGIWTDGVFSNTGGTITATSTSGSAYGIWTNGDIDLTKLGTVSATSTNGTAVGVHFGDGSIELNDNTIQGLNITVNGNDRFLFEGGIATVINNSTTLNAGLSTVSGTINNNLAGVINAKSIGLKVEGESSVVNNLGTINVMPDSTSNRVVYGIYATNQATVHNAENGLIKVNNTSKSASKAYGVYLNNSSLNNEGTIHINLASNTTGNYGVYAVINSTFTNSGIIRRTINNASEISCEGNACYTGVKDRPPFFYLDSTSSYINSGTTVSSSSIDFNKDFGEGKVMLSTGGTYEAPELSGNLSIANEVVADGFEKSYTLSDAIISDNTSNLSLNSESIMFDADLDGNDVVLNKKAFSDVVDNSSMADFLEKNYQLANNDDLFGILKSQSSKAALNGEVKALMGDSLSRFLDEDMTMMKELSFDMNNKLFDNKDQYFSLTGNTSPISFDGNIGSNSKWSLSGARYGNLSLGVGVAFTDISSQDGNNDNSRFDRMFTMMAPMGYKTRGFEFVVSPRAGYAYGTYDRTGYNSMNYDGKIEKKIFGLTGDVRYLFKVKGHNLSPMVELNAIGYHIKGRENEREYSLNIPSQNIYSLETGVGFNINKEYNFQKGSQLSFNNGLMMYHEFLNPYEMRLQMRGMDGSYKITDERRRDNRIALRNEFDYKFDNVSLYGSLISYIDSEYRTNANLGLKFEF